MRGLQTLNILLTISDFSILITRDIDDAILRLVKDIYDNKCYQLKYIHSINKILFRSNIQANQFDLSGTFNVDLVVQVDCEYFSYQESLMTMKVVKIIPHIPYYLDDGNKLIQKWKEAFTDRLGNKATLTKVEVLTKKNKINEYVIQVEWE